ANQNTAIATAAAGAFQTPYDPNYPRSRTSSSGNSSATGTAYIPAGILVPGVRGPLAVSPVEPSPPSHFSWIALVLPCIFISGIIWIASLLLCRTQSAALRVGIVSLSLLAIVAAAAFVPVQSPPAHAQARPEPHATQFVALRNGMMPGSSRFTSAPSESRSSESPFDFFFGISNPRLTTPSLQIPQFCSPGHSGPRTATCPLPPTSF